MVDRKFQLKKRKKKYLYSGARDESMKTRLSVLYYSYYLENREIPLASHFNSTCLDRIQLNSGVAAKKTACSAESMNSVSGLDRGQS